MMPTLRLKTGREWLKELNVGDEVLFSDGEYGTIDSVGFTDKFVIENKIVRMKNDGCVADDSCHLKMK